VESRAIKGHPLPRIFKFRGGIPVRSVQYYAVYTKHKICLLKLSRNEKRMRKKADMMLIAIINLFCIDYVQMK